MRARRSPTPASGAAGPVSAPALGQVAFNHVRGGLRAWYRDGLGLPTSGMTLFAGQLAAKVNGLPSPVFPGRWLVDGRERVQLEFFRFRRPRPAARRPDETAADLGYRRVGFHLRDFDATLATLAALGSEPVGPVVGAAGARRACVRDPEGNWVELLEDDPLAGRPTGDAPATLRAVTVSVADLDAAADSWARLGLARAETVLHSERHEALWGLPGADRRTLVLDGGSGLIELVEYLEPRGRPLPDGYRICDQGIMNVALVAADRASFDRAFAEWVARGLRPTSPRPLDLGIFRVMYFTLPTGESVELLYPRRWAWRLTGFRATPPALARVAARIRRTTGGRPRGAT